MTVQLLNVVVDKPQAVGESIIGLIHCHHADILASRSSQIDHNIYWFHKSFECQCKDGFIGKYWESNIDDCSSPPCMNGVCIDEVNGFKCLWTGLLKKASF